MSQIFRPGKYDENGRLIVPRHEEGVPGVYFLSAAGVNLIKIGHVRKSHRAIDRVDALQPGCPYRLSLLFVLPEASRYDEARLHKLYSKQNFDREWFRCEGPLKGFLQLAIAIPEQAAEQLRTYLDKQKILT